MSYCFFMRSSALCISDSRRYRLSATFDFPLMSSELSWPQFWRRGVREFYMQCSFPNPDVTICNTCLLAESVKAKHIHFIQQFSKYKFASICKNVSHITVPKPQVSRSVTSLSTNLQLIYPRHLTFFQTTKPYEFTWSRSELAPVP